MGEFTFQCSIDGQDYSLELLAMVRYQRDIHVLHETKRAGATREHDGRTLSHDDINLLGAEQAFAVSVAVRNSYDRDGQFKPLENGLAVKAGCCFPAKAPKEMVEGHKLHLALEFLGFARAIAAAR
jgi:hypothetical protein